jgi:anti-sigma factor RsiW
MSCSPFDLKDYFLGELAAEQAAAVKAHAAACTACQEELHALQLTRAALLSVPDEEPPRRIAFVSDKIFEPSWWRRFLHSGPQLGFASAAMLAAAIVVHGFASRVPAQPAATVQTQDVRAAIDAEVSKQVNAAVEKAVANAELRQTAQLLDVVNVRLRQAENRRRTELVEIQDYVLRMHKMNANYVRQAMYEER